MFLVTFYSYFDRPSKTKKKKKKREREIQSPDSQRRTEEGTDQREAAKARQR